MSYRLYTFTPIQSWTFLTNQISCLKAAVSMYGVDRRTSVCVGLRSVLSDVRDLIHPEKHWITGTLLAIRLTSCSTHMNTYTHQKSDLSIYYIQTLNLFFKQVNPLITAGGHKSHIHQLTTVFVLICTHDWLIDFSFFSFILNLPFLCLCHLKASLCRLSWLRLLNSIHTGYCALMDSEKLIWRSSFCLSASDGSNPLLLTDCKPAAGLSFPLWLSLSDLPLVWSWGCLRTMRFFSFSREVLCGTLDCCPRVRAEPGRLGSLGGGMRVVVVVCCGGIRVAACSAAGASGVSVLPSARRASASGVWGELSIRVAVTAFW